MTEYQHQRTVRVSENQKTWLQRLTEQGYLAKVCYGFDEAIRCIEEYYDER